MSSERSLRGTPRSFRETTEIVRNRGPVGDGEWRLYDISRDPGETTDLAGVYPAKLQRMLSQYQSYAKRNGVLPVPSGYDPQRQVAINGLGNRARPGILVGVLMVVTLLFFYLFHRASPTAPSR